MARSSRPSPLRSAIATELGAAPVVRNGSDGSATVEVHTRQAPATQRLRPHEVLHAPQLTGSDLRSAHAFPHFVVPPKHWTSHLPVEHSRPMAHAIPHPPQL